MRTIDMLSGSGEFGRKSVTQRRAVSATRASRRHSREEARADALRQPREDAQRQFGNATDVNSTDGRRDETAARSETVNESQRQEWQPKWHEECV